MCGVQVAKEEPGGERKVIMTSTVSENSERLYFGASMALPADRTAEQARLMEELGFEYMGAGEHFMRGRPPGPTHAALPLLAVAAGATERLRLVSSVTLAPFYHPLMLARMTATLDIASGGRLTLGVGVGGEFPMEYENAGIDIRQRGRRTDECLDGLRRLWTEDSVSMRGRHYTLDEAAINPKPTQQAASAGVGSRPARRGDAAGGALRGRLAAVFLQPGTLPGQHDENWPVRR